MQSEELIRKAAEAIWAIRREEEDRCDMSLDDMGGKESSVWQEAKAALEAAISTAEPVAYRVRMNGQVWQLRHVIHQFDTWDIIEPLYAAPPAPSVAVKDLEWDESPHHAYNIAFGYQIAVIGDRVVLRCPLSASSEHENILSAKAAANEHHRSRIAPALSAQVQDVAAKSLADAYQKYLDALNLYNERHAIMKTKALGTMRVDEEYKAIDEARRAFDKLAVDIAKSALPAAPAKQEGGE